MRLPGYMTFGNTEAKQVKQFQLLRYMLKKEQRETLLFSRKND